MALFTCCSTCDVRDGPLRDAPLQEMLAAIPVLLQCQEETCTMFFSDGLPRQGTDGALKRPKQVKRDRRLEFLDLGEGSNRPKLAQLTQ